MKRFLAILVFAFFVAGTLTFHSFYLFLSPPPPAEPEAKVVRIQPGMGLRPIARVLAEEGIIQDPYKFMLLAWWKGVVKKIQWGDFEMHTGEPAPDGAGLFDFREDPVETGDDPRRIHPQTDRRAFGP